jgi:hypothetical protein
MIIFCVYGVAFADWHPTLRASRPFWKLIYHNRCNPTGNLKLHPHPHHLLQNLHALLGLYHSRHIDHHHLVPGFSSLSSSLFLSLQCFLFKLYSLLDPSRH